MPQLDILTFFSQIFWLVIFFWSLYAISFYYVLVPICFLLKMRHKKIKLLQGNSSLLEKGIEDINLFYDKTGPLFWNVILNTLTKISSNYKESHKFHTENSIKWINSQLNSK